MLHYGRSLSTTVFEFSSCKTNCCRRINIKTLFIYNFLFSNRTFSVINVSVSLNSWRKMLRMWVTMEKIRGIAVSYDVNSDASYVFRIHVNTVSTAFGSNCVLQQIAHLPNRGRITSWDGLRTKRFSAHTAFVCVYSEKKSGRNFVS